MSGRYKDVLLGSYVEDAVAREVGLPIRRGPATPYGGADGGATGVLPGPYPLKPPRTSEQAVKDPTSPNGSSRKPA